MVDVVMYTTMFCPFCVRAKQMLKAKGVAFDEIDVTMSQVKRAEMTERSGGGRTVPQIFIGDELIGGCDELYALEHAGELDGKLGLAA
ncbi:MAG: glutaredoxin 3 [Rhodospirillales bacterium]|nr:glutaredoxin 3 [Rhodospirillales bacterium]